MIKFYGYNRCSTSQKAKKYLDNHDVSYDYQDLIKQPPTKQQWLTWFKLHPNRPLRSYFNTSGIHYRQQHLKDQMDSMTEQKAAELLSTDGKLIKRPLVVSDNKLTSGFKQEVFDNTWL